MSELTFAEWLLLQVNRDDLVGDVAKEFAEDRRSGCASAVSSLASFLGHMVEHHSASWSVAEGPVNVVADEWHGGVRDDD